MVPSFEYRETVSTNTVLIDNVQAPVFSRSLRVAVKSQGRDYFLIAPA